MKHRLDRDTAQARFDEGIEILMRAWTGETFSYSGKAWAYEEISCRPQPCRNPIHRSTTARRHPTARRWLPGAVGI